MPEVFEGRRQQRETDISHPVGAGQRVKGLIPPLQDQFIQFPRGRLQRLVAVPHVGNTDSIRRIIVRVDRAILDLQVHTGFAFDLDHLYHIAGCRVDADFDQFRRLADDRLRVRKTHHSPRLILDAKDQMPAVGIGEGRDRFQPAARLLFFQLLLVVCFGGFDVEDILMGHGVSPIRLKHVARSSINQATY